MHPELSFLLKGIILGFSIAAPVGPIGFLCIRRTGIPCRAFSIARTTAVRCAFQSPQSIGESNELALTGNDDEAWLHEHVGQRVTLSGYLWHAHTTHHPTTIMMDTQPWFKDPCVGRVCGDHP